MWRSEFRQNYRTISRPQFHLSLLGSLASLWTYRHLAVKVGMSKGRAKQWQTIPKNLPKMQCQSHTGHMTGFWLLPTRPLRLNTNEWLDESGTLEFFKTHAYAVLAMKTVYLLKLFTLKYGSEGIVKKRSVIKFHCNTYSFCLYYLTYCI